MILKFQEGINELYLKVEWNKLTDILIWKSAAAQVFYSLATGQGVHLILASYNGFRTNCQRDSLLIGELFHSNNLQFIVILLMKPFLKGLINSATSIFAGFVVFGTVGIVAKNRGRNPQDVITEVK